MMLIMNLPLLVGATRVEEARQIIAAVNKRCHKRTHKFGFETPKTVERAREIDRENGNTLWQDATAKEMAAAWIAFVIVNDGEEPPVGCQHMECHLAFETKMETNFRRKARLVAGGHMTETPAALTCSSVVSRETARIALTIAALNDSQVKTSDIQNACLTAPCEEKTWTTLGPEFGADQGKKALLQSLAWIEKCGSIMQSTHF